MPHSADAEAFSKVRPASETGSAPILLPTDEKKNIPARYGMRHKAAIGITEETDADVIVVSEETGNISFVKGGVVTPIQNINELKLLLTTALGE